MRSNWVARCFFATVAVMAIAGVASGTACTRWSHPGPVVPTVAPLSAIYVDAATGSDTSGNGSQESPYKTVTKAVAVLDAAKSVASSVAINVGPGDYDVANGEIFPIVVTKSVTITGSNYGSGPHGGTFIDGFGEDKLFESLVHAPAQSAYTTLEIAPPANVSMGDVYLGASKISLRGSQSFYASLDVLVATFTANTSSFAAGIASTLRNLDGVIVPGGSFTCASCSVHGNDFGIGAFAVPVATSEPSPVIPTVALSHQSGDSTVAAKVVDVLTDGNVDVSAADTSFLRAAYAYADAFKPLIATNVRGVVDFGGGAVQSPGNNSFLGARLTEIYVTRRFETISAFDDVWNPRQQQANRNGLYLREITFAADASGKNVTIHHIATGSTVMVGPAPVPTPTPSTTPSSGPTSTPT